MPGIFCCRKSQQVDLVTDPAVDIRQKDPNDKAAVSYRKRDSSKTTQEFHNPGLVNEQVTIPEGQCEQPRRSTGQSDNEVIATEDFANSNGNTNTAFPTCHFTEVKIHVVPEADGEPHTK